MATKKRTSLDALISAPETSKARRSKVPLSVAEPEVSDESKAQIVRHTAYLPEPVYDQLRTLAFEERRKMHDYLLEGLDLVFKKRGLKSVAQLIEKS